MIPWYLITLAEESQKTALTLTHLAEHGIHPKVILGFNGHLIGLRPIVPHELAIDGTPRYMHPAQVGCVLSHLTALATALTDDAEQFIIAENDVHLPPDFTARFDWALKALPDEAQIFQMQYYGLHQPPGLQECADTFGTACIFWKREAARQALRLLRPIESPFDVMLIRKVYPFLKHYVVEPPLVRERTSGGEWPSSVQGKDQC